MIVEIFNIEPIQLQSVVIWRKGKLFYLLLHLSMDI